MQFFETVRNHVMTTIPKPKNAYEERWSAQTARVRLAIENLFGLFTRKWWALSDIWTRDYVQHHQTWYFACYLHNCRIIHDGFSLGSEEDIKKIKANKSGKQFRKSFN